MALDMDAFLAAEQAAGLRRLGEASTNYLATLDRVMLGKYTEVDLKEAAAAKELISGPLPREMSALSLSRQIPQAG